MTFLGSATLIGGDLFLSAKHVFVDGDGPPSHSEIVVDERGATRPALGILRVKEELEIVFVPIDWVEPHPECDLVIGKLINWNAAPLWEAIARPAALNDATAVGHPYERWTVVKADESIIPAFKLSALREGLRDAGAETVYDQIMPEKSFELSSAHAWHERLSGLVRGREDEAEVALWHRDRLARPVATDES